jgi:hypothetical protein
MALGCRPDLFSVAHSSTITVVQAADKNLVPQEHKACCAGSKTSFKIPLKQQQQQQQQQMALHSRPCMLPLLASLLLCSIWASSAFEEVLAVDTIAGVTRRLMEATATRDCSTVHKGKAHTTVSAEQSCVTIFHSSSSSSSSGSSRSRMKRICTAAASALHPAQQLRTLPYSIVYTGAKTPACITSVLLLLLLLRLLCSMFTLQAGQGRSNNTCTAAS